MKRFRTIITGKVQGVLFRASARDQAVTMGIQGFVRNLPDGTVELDAEGDEDSLHNLLSWCQHGPPGARVDQVDITWLPPEGGRNHFVISP